MTASPIDDPRVRVDKYMVCPTGYDELVNSDRDMWCLAVTDGHAWGWSIRRGMGIIDGERSSLWSFMADAVRELRPRYVVVENVAAVLSRSRDGVIPLEVVAADLAEIGFDLRWDCIPAASVGACHRRDRWFGVAYPDRAGLPDVQGGSPLTERAGWRTPDRATWWRTEPDVGRVVHGVPSRLDRRDNRRRIHALGNAVVPQVSEYVGRLIVDHHLAACAA